MIEVLPQPKAGKDRISGVNNAVIVASVSRFIKFSQGNESIRLIRRRLRREVSKQFAAIIDAAVAVAIQTKPGVIRRSAGPAYLFGRVIGIQIEIHARGVIRKVETIA